MMTTEKIHKGYERLARVRQLYEEAFPPQERIDFDRLMALMDVCDVEFAAYIDDDDRFVGFTYAVLYDSGRLCWFYYFAVVPQLRGRGVGERVLTAFLSAHDKQRVVIDIEDPQQPSANQTIRRRRHAFYDRHGIHDAGVKRSFAGVDYNIMVTTPPAMRGEPFTSDDYQALLDDLWHHLG